MTLRRLAVVVVALALGGIVVGLVISGGGEGGGVRTIGGPPNVSWPSVVECRPAGARLSCALSTEETESDEVFRLAATYNYVSVGQPFTITEISTSDRKAIVCDPAADELLSCVALPTSRAFFGEVALYSTEID